jgi:hypothetical protein
MSQVHYSAACLRLFGDDLEPDEITHILRCAPTAAHRTGEVIRYKSGRERVVKCGNWQLNANKAEPEDINRQVRWLLSQVEPDPDAWKRLTQRFEVDIYCGLFMKRSNEGFSLAPDVMALLGERGIHLGFEIYSDIDDAVAANP